MSKKKKHEEHENHERWLVSYADFITLLFAFFVVMYSVSRVDNKRLERVSNSIRWALNFEGNGGVGQMPIFEGPPSEGGCVVNVSSGSNSNPKNKKIIEQMRKRLEERLKHHLQEKQSKPSVIIHSDHNRLSVRMAAGRFFDVGQAALRPEALPIVDAIAQELHALGRPVRVEGHTDDGPLGTGRYRDNWELSASRAASVTGYLERAHAFDAAALTASGMGAARPVAPNDTSENRELNRRIELVVELQPGDALSNAAF